MTQEGAATIAAVLSPGILLAGFLTYWFYRAWKAKGAKAAMLRAAATLVLALAPFALLYLSHVTYVEGLTNNPLIGRDPVLLESQGDWSGWAFAITTAAYGLFSAATVFVATIFCIAALATMALRDKNLALR